MIKKVNIMMHKACIITFIAMLATLFALLNAATIWAQDSPCVANQGMAWVRGEVVPAIGNLADHTYVVAQTTAGGHPSWGCFGRNQGGAVLPATQAAPISNTYRICFMASQGPCKWPITLYLVVGVCHQLSNRGLYTAGTTVWQARAYGLSSWFFGPYGKAIYLPVVWQYRMNNCLNNAPGPAASSYTIIKAGYTTGDKSNEYILFKEGYLPKLEEAEKRHNEEEQYRLLNQYRRQVVSLRLDEAGVSSGAKIKVLDYYDKSVQEIEELMAAFLQKKNMNFAEYQKKMNVLLEAVQKQLKEYLSKEQYTKFTNAPFDKTLVWEDFEDKPTP